MSKTKEKLFWYLNASRRVPRNIMELKINERKGNSLNVESKK